MDACSHLRTTILASLGLAISACGSKGNQGSSSASAKPAVSHDPNGYVLEASSARHRAEARSCDKTNDDPSCKGTEQNLSCKVDGDCKEGPNGKCNSGVVIGRRSEYCACRYTCETDADCGAGKACVCKGEGKEGLSVCVTASCRTDSDCASGDCALSNYFNGCVNEMQLGCRTPSDACHTDQDCGQRDGGSPYDKCVFHEGKWGCHGMTCVIGRPFFVEGELATARTKGREDWLEADDAIDWASSFNEEESAAGAEHWKRIAALEHASVASFARFTLQLLSLGAPPELVRDSQQASLDEIEHARIASALEGNALGPDRLPQAIASAPSGVGEIVFALVREGCVGETLGALEARLQAEACHPALRASLHRIAEDEARHAELAWKSLAWLVRTFRDEARVAAAAAFDRATEEITSRGRTPPTDGETRSLGIVAGAELEKLHLRALREVVQPARAALHLC